MMRRRLQRIVRKTRSKVRKKRRLRMKKMHKRIKNQRAAKVNRMIEHNGISFFLIRITTQSQKDS
jgi:hypothetical protein